jgi:hypothetical protein
LTSRIPSSLSEDMHRRIAGSQLIIYPDSATVQSFDITSNSPPPQSNSLTIDPEPTPHISKLRGKRRPVAARWPQRIRQAKPFGLACPSVELPGIEPVAKMALSWENTGFHDAKRPPSTCGYAEGVDGINMHTPPLSVRKRHWIPGSRQRAINEAMYKSQRRRCPSRAIAEVDFTLSLGEGPTLAGR